MKLAIFTLIISLVCFGSMNYFFMKRDFKDKLAAPVMLILMLMVCLAVISVLMSVGGTP